MFFSRYVHKCEIEEIDHCNPPVDSCAGLNIGVVQHPLDVFCIDLNLEGGQANEIQA